MSYRSPSPGYSSSSYNDYYYFYSPPPPYYSYSWSTTSYDYSPSSSSSSSSGVSTGIVAGIIVGAVVVVVLLVACCVCCARRRKRRKKAERVGSDVETNHVIGQEDPQIDHRKDSNVPPPNNAPTYSANFAVHNPPAPPPEVMSSYSSAPMSDSSCPERPPPPVSPRLVFALSQSTFTFEELERATGGFSGENLLGQGGFGYVHKGVLPSGKVVAVKQLKAGSGQGEREFRAEVEVISRVHHRHLVSLVGYCISGDRRLLVYEFVQNGTMEFHLHGRRRPTMSWEIRMKIAQGSAKGLAYLHEDCQPKIIHRDIKSANILIDHDFEAKVADFGLAKFSFETETHVSTRIMGTLGYLAPEYAASGKLTDKSDVFSFGVVLLELITGRRPIDKNLGFADDSLVEWAKPLLREALEGGELNGLVDPRLQNEYDPVEVKRVIACASACVRHSARLRPRMSQIIRALEGNIPLDDLNNGVKPDQSAAYGSMTSGEYRKDMENFRKLALGSQELSTADYSVPSTASTLNHSGWSSGEGQRTT